MTTETWKQVPNFPSYEVSDLGRVRSWKTKKPRYLKPSKSGGCYFVILCSNGNRYFKRVHRLVLIAFVGLPPEGYECGHRDGNPSNNRISNLRWITHKENMVDRDIHGTTPKGGKNGNSKLTESEVRLIRNKLSDGLKQETLAKMFNISQPMICCIKRRENWVSVKD